jgi:MFS family permease
MVRSLLALDALNFFVADVRDGLGPFLGVYLQEKQWSPSEIGVMMTAGGIAGMIATAPLGAVVDRIKAKRLLMAASAIAIVAASLLILFVPTFTATATAQIVIGIAGAAVVPAIAGITLGLVKQKGFAHQVGRNEAFNHAGNLAAALACALFGYIFGLTAVFVVMGGMAIASLIALSLIDPGEIDYKAARGASAKADNNIAGFSVLLTSKPLLVLSVTLLLFHLGNAAMLPLLGQSLVAQHAGDPSAYTGATVIVAQLTMIPMALWAAKLAVGRGYWIVFLLALLALPLRGTIAAFVTGPLGLFPVQILDGVGAGLLGVAVPGLAARILDGTGRVNSGIGVVMAVQGAGAAISPAAAGFVAEKYGYAAAFLFLGGIALVALVVWVAATPLIAEACGTSKRASRSSGVTLP